MSTASVNIDQLVIDKLRAQKAAEEWVRIAAALALEHGEVRKDGTIVARVPKSLFDRLNHRLEVKAVRGGYSVTLTPVKEGGD